MSLNCHLEEIIGKKITGVVAVESHNYPKSRLFLIFEDGTSFELYGENMHNAKRLRESDVISYIDSQGDSQVIFKRFLTK